MTERYQPPIGQTYIHPDEWPDEDRKIARSEGWDMFATLHRLDDISYAKIQRIDHPAHGEVVFPDDWHAIAYVAKRAAEGSELHRKAIRLQGMIVTMLENDDHEEKT